MTDAIIDSNFLIGLIDAHDKWHPKCIELLKILNDGNWRIVYFDCVLAESISTLARRLEEKNRMSEFSSLLHNFKELIPHDSITWILSDIQKNYDDALKLMDTHKGKLNFNDALIALAAKNFKFNYIASFDQDFDEIEWLKRLSSS